MARLEFFRKGFTLGLAIIVLTAAGVIPAEAYRPPIDTEDMAPIALDVQAATVQSVLRMFSEFAGVNIISGPEVDGKITAKIEGVPWLVALDTVLRTNGYGWERLDDIIRVTTLEKLNNERLNEEVVERKREEFLPLETAVMRVSYAKADEMKKPLEILLSTRGKIEPDLRTNALIVTDIHDRLESIREMVTILDYRTPQVEIEAKLVDVDTRKLRSLGIDWETSGLNQGDVKKIDLSADFDLPEALQVGTVDFELIGTDGDLTAQLEALARNDFAEIISNPKITTADNKEAKIIVGKKIPLVVSDESGNAITELTTIGIKLTVIPHINQDNRVTLDLVPEVSDLSSQATVQGGIVIVTAEASTRVIVNDGQTAVIGGLVRTNDSSVENGIPYLMDVPVLGNLFKTSTDIREQRELIILVTPKIVMPDQA
jgi:type IV pilus assembly protein PilQ